jgi:hypothetical protein
VKYKALKSAAHNFGNSFASTLNYAAGDYIMSHLARRALASGLAELKVDLLSGEAGPPELIRVPVDTSISDRVRWFPSLLTSQGIDPAVVRQAAMRIVFDVARCTAPETYSGYTVSEMPFDCWVTLLDDHGRTHTGHFRRDWAFSRDGVEFEPPRRPSVWQRLWIAVRGLLPP